MRKNKLYIYINPTIVYRNNCISIPYKGQAILIKYPKKKTLHLDSDVNNIFVTLNNEILIFTYNIKIPYDAETIIYTLNLGSKTIFKLIKKLLFNELEFYFKRIEKKINKLSGTKLI